MRKSQNRWLVILLCFNAVLFTAVIMELAPLPQAQAQVRSHDYILIPGNLQLGKQVVWIVDLNSHELTSCLYNKNNRSIDFGDIITLMQ